MTTAKRGRPKRAKVYSTKRLNASCTDGEYTAAKRAAEAVKEPLPEFVRGAVAERVEMVARKGKGAA